MPRRISSTPQKQPPAMTATSRLPEASLPGRFSASELFAAPGLPAAPALSNSDRYWPYPSSSSFPAGTKRSAAEFMQ